MQISPRIPPFSNPDLQETTAGDQIHLTKRWILGKPPSCRSEERQLPEGPGTLEPRPLHGLPLCREGCMIPRPQADCGSPGSVVLRDE